MDLREALYTTRAMRRVSSEPIPTDALKRILDAAIRAPSSGNSQDWRFLVVDSEAVKAKLGPLYRAAVAEMWATSYAERIAMAAGDPESEESQALDRFRRSVQYLADHFESVPLFLFGFAREPSGRSILPAVWSAQLAARDEGIGSAMTSVLGHYRAEETLAALGVPGDGTWLLACCVSFGRPLGRWGLAVRRPVEEVAYRNEWGGSIGFSVPEPLWRGERAAERQ